MIRFYLIAMLMMGIMGSSVSAATEQSLPVSHLQLLTSGKKADALAQALPDVSVQVAYKDGATSDQDFRTVKGQDGLKSFYMALTFLQTNEIKSFKCDEVNEAGTLCVLNLCETILKNCRAYRLLYVVKDDKIALVRGIDDIRNPETRARK